MILELMNGAAQMFIYIQVLRNEYFSDYHSYNSEVINPETFRTWVVSGAYSSKTTAGVFEVNSDADRSTPTSGYPAICSRSLTTGLSSHQFK